MENYSLLFCNDLKKISVMYGYTGSSEKPKEIPPNAPPRPLEIETGKALNIWLNPGDAAIPEIIYFDLNENYKTSSGPGGNYATQVIRSFGIPPGPGAKSARKTPIWTIMWVSLDFSPHPGRREGAYPEIGVNVTISSPETSG